MPTRALIVEDHRVVLQGMKMSLALDAEFEGFGEAGKGEQALVMVKNLSPDVALMDLLMPGMDGITVRQAIREDHRDIVGMP